MILVKNTFAERRGQHLFLTGKRTHEDGSTELLFGTEEQALGFEVEADCWAYLTRSKKGVPLSDLGVRFIRIIEGIKD